MRIDAVDTGQVQAAYDSACPSKQSADTESAKRACKEFESILIYQMLSSMRRAFETDDDSEADFGGDLFKSMMDEQLSIALAKVGGIGLSGLLERGLGLAEPKTERKQDAPAVIKPAGDTKSDAGPVEKVAALPGKLWAKLKRYDATIRAAASTFGLSTGLIQAVIMQESGGDAKAVSHKGAKGLMQLMDATSQDLGVTDPFDPVQNIFGGARLLARLLASFEGNLELALASYNAGIGAVKKHGGIPPFKETQEYVTKVKRNLASLGLEGETLR
jgi:soluble lytic murein transglycosylase-like protein